MLVTGIKKELLLAGLQKQVEVYPKWKRKKLEKKNALGFSKNLLACRNC